MHRLCLFVLCGLMGGCLIPKEKVDCHDNGTCPAADMSLSMPDLLMSMPDMDMVDQPPSPECLKDDDCQAKGDGLGCKAQKCVTCADHADCTSNLCDVYTRKCFKEATILYVDSDMGKCMGGDGMRDKPLCKIDDAVKAIVEGRSNIRVMAGTYAKLDLTAVTLNGKTIAIYGAGQGGGDPHRQRCRGDGGEYQQ